MGIYQVQLIHLLDVHFERDVHMHMIVVLVDRPELMEIEHDHFVACHLYS